MDFGWLSAPKKLAAVFHCQRHPSIPYTFLNFFQFSDENSWKGSQIPAREVCRLDVTLWMSSGCTFGAQGKARQGHTQKMVCEVCPAGSRFLAHIEKPDKMTQNDTANRQIYATSMPWQLVREGSDTCCIITWTLVAPCCWRRTTVMHCAHFLNTTAVFASESGVPSVHRKNGRTSPRRDSLLAHEFLLTPC